MTLLPGDAQATDTGVVSTDKHSKLINAKKVIHTGSMLLALDDALYYYQTNGQDAASFLKPSPQIVDISYNQNIDQLYALTFTLPYLDTELFYKSGYYYDNFIEDVRFDTHSSSTVSSGVKTIWREPFNSFGSTNFTNTVPLVDSNTGRIENPGTVASNFFRSDYFIQNHLQTSGTLDAKSDFSIESFYDRELQNYTTEAIYGLFTSIKTDSPTVENSVVYKEGFVVISGNTYQTSYAVSGLNSLQDVDFRPLWFHYTFPPLELKQSLSIPFSTLYNTTTVTGYIDVTYTGTGPSNSGTQENIQFYTDVLVANISNSAPVGNSPYFYTSTTGSAGVGVNTDYRVYYQIKPVPSGAGFLGITSISGSSSTTYSGSSSSTSGSYLSVELDHVEPVLSGNVYYELTTDVYYANPSGVPTSGAPLDNKPNLYFNEFRINTPQNATLDSIYTTTTGAVAFSGLQIDEIDFRGNVQNNIIDYLEGNFKVLDYRSTDVLDQDTVVNILKSSFNFAVDESDNAYIKAYEDIYTVSLTGSFIPSTAYDETNPNIFVTSGAFTGEVYDLFFNRNDSGFLQYTTFEPALDEIIIKTLSLTGTSPMPDDRQLFVGNPDWITKQEIVQGSGIESSFYLHGIDHNTLYLNTYDPTISATRINSYNIDTTVPAFAGVNLNDTTLRAGTNQSSSIRTDVINVWGDPLNNIVVQYDVIQGDGVTVPQSSITNVSGQSLSTYNVGTTPGQVIIRSTISD